MKKYPFIILIFLFGFILIPCFCSLSLWASDGQTTKSIILIIDDTLENDFDAELELFTSDLQAENYNVIITYSNYQTPEEVRSYLQSVYTTTSPLLIGALLLGQIPLARQYYYNEYSNPDIEPTEHDGVSIQFYSDLDGNFYKNNPEYPDSYSEHDGDRESEIWISLLPWFTDENTTITKIKEYLNKNHAYRKSLMTREEGFLWVNEHKNAEDRETYDAHIDAMVHGVYSWSPFTEWGNTGLFIHNSIGGPDPEYAYTYDLQSTKYRFAALTAHGSVAANGLLTISDLNSMSITPPFIWLGGCNTANLDYNSNFATELIYQSMNSTLAIKGGSANVGGLGNNEDGFFGHNIATAMLEGKSLGEAYLYHNNTPLISPWLEDYELHNAFTIFIGDFSLTLYPQSQNEDAPGDVNDNGSVDIVDALLIAQYYVGLDPAGFNAAAADTDCDGAVTIVDALLIAQFYVGLITQLC